MRAFRAESGYDVLVVALVVTALGIAASLPRGEPSRTGRASAIPATPCKGVAAEHRPACLAAARAILER